MNLLAMASHHMNVSILLQNRSKNVTSLLHIIASPLKSLRYSSRTVVMPLKCFCRTVEVFFEPLRSYYSAIAILLQNCYYIVAMPLENRCNIVTEPLRSCFRTVTMPLQNRSMLLQCR